MIRRCATRLTNMAPNVVFVLGGPGSGKGTQCELIVKHYNFEHLSAGELLRREQTKNGSKYKDLIQHHMKEGTIVPAEITCNLLRQAMNESGKKNFLVDGYPRNEDNLVTWQRVMGEAARVLFVLFFECPLEVCVERCLGRGEAGSGREDDNLESLKKRIGVFLKETQPIVDYYDKLDLVKRVDGSREKDLVFDDVKRVFLQEKPVVTGEM